MLLSYKQVNTKYILEWKLHEVWDPVGLTHGYTRSYIDIYFFKDACMYLRNVNGVGKMSNLIFNLKEILKWDLTLGRVIT